MKRSFIVSYTLNLFGVSAKGTTTKWIQKNMEKRKSYGNIWNTANRSIVTFFGKILRIFDPNIFRAQ